MSTKVENIELLLKAPTITKKIPLVLFCGIARAPDIASLKKLWATLESLVDDNPDIPAAQYENSLPDHFQPSDPTKITTITLAIDGREKIVLNRPLLLFNSIAIISDPSDFDTLRLYSRRGTLFLQNFLKLKENDYSERQTLIRNWACKNFDQWQRMKSGQIQTIDPVVDYHCYLHYNSTFDKSIEEVTHIVVTEEDLAGVLDVGVSVGLAGLLGGLGVGVKVEAPLGAEEE